MRDSEESVTPSEGFGDRTAPPLERGLTPPGMPSVARWGRRSAEPCRCLSSCKPSRTLLRNGRATCPLPRRSSSTWTAPSSARPGPSERWPWPSATITSGSWTPWRGTPRPRSWPRPPSGTSPSRRATSCSSAPAARARPCWRRPWRSTWACPSPSPTPPPSLRRATSARTWRRSSTNSWWPPTWTCSLLRVGSSTSTRSTSSERGVSTAQRTCGWASSTPCSN